MAKDECEYRNSTRSNGHGYSSPTQMSFNESKRRERAKRIADKLREIHNRRANG